MYNGTLVSIVASDERPGSIGPKLKELRLAKRWSLREAARRLGISYSRLSDFEGGRTHSTQRPALPGPEVLARASEVYGFPEEMLLALAGHKLAESRADYVPTEVDVEIAEIAAIYRRLSPGRRNLLIQVVRAFDRSGDG